jgi:hypothetical protein
MATIALAVVGSAIGGAIGGTFLGISAAAIGMAVGATIGGAIDSRLLAPKMPNQRIEGPRLESLRVVQSAEGAVLSRIYGRMRAGGTIIWATDFREQVITSTSGGGGGGKGGGGGGGGGTVTTTEYKYFVSFALAICEGPISGIGRIWADGALLDLEDLTWRWYPGDESQTPDPFIAEKMGAANTPAYRGTAYIVFEELPVANFGDRIPQISVEVFRPIDEEDTAEGLTTGVNLIPATGEFAYSTQEVRARLSEGASKTENAHTPTGASNVVESLDRLEASAPNLETVSLVVSWFGDDLRAGECAIQPYVETSNKNTEPLTWSVNGVRRSSASVVSRDSSGNPVFGGTPSDNTVVELIQEIKSRGWKVVFYPFILMDVPPGNTLPNPYSDNAAESGQPEFPWRGRITCSPAAGFAGTVDKTAAAASQVNAFFGAATAAQFSVTETSVSYTGPASEWGYRRMVLHYAHLCDAAGGVDDFVIGTELRGLTWIRSSATSYPAVTKLRTLAGDVKSIVGAGTRIGYAADWSEYFGHHPDDGTGDVFFHLDPLWADMNIDFIGIDNYMPLSDWRDGHDHLDAQDGWASIYDRDYLMSNVQGGEGYDFFYASTADRESQTRTPITDGQGKPWVFRYKDLQNWWSNEHINRLGGVEGSLTDQTTELGEAEGYAEATVEVVPGLLVVGSVTISLKLRNISDGGSLTLETATKGNTDILGDVVQLSATEWEYDLTDAIPTDTLVFEFGVTAPGLDDNTLTITIKPVATGGTVHDVDRDGETWRVHVFDALPQDAGHQDGEDNDNPIPTIQNFRVNEPISEMRVLVVGGGARGNTGNYQYSSSGGGGSAGEFFETFLNNVSEGIYEVQVGKGGGWSGSPAETYWSASPSRFEFINAARGVEGSSYEDEDDFFDVTFVGGAGGDYPGPEGWEGGGSVFQQLWPVFGRPGAGGGAGAGGNGEQGEYGSGIFLTGSYITHGAGGAGGAGVTSDITGFNEVYCEGGAGAGPVTGIFRERGFDSYPTPKPSAKGSGGVGGWSIHNGLSQSYGGRELTRPGHGSDGVVVVSYRLPRPATPWVPESKPIVFTELGCPAIDRGTNQPNVFFDPKTSESFVPYFSRGWRDDAIQRSYIEATLLYWNDTSNNPTSSIYSGRMLDTSMSCVWTWDARPYPFFPALSDVWTDSENYRLGHWLGGRLGSAGLGALVRDICRRAGLQDSEIDVSKMWGSVDGYTINVLESARASITMLAEHFGFDAVEVAGKIKFTMRDKARVTVLTLDDLVSEGGSQQGDFFELTREQETDLPLTLRWATARSDEEFDTSMVEARRSTVDSSRVEQQGFPIAVAPEESARRCRRALQEKWTTREKLVCSVPPSLLRLDAGDVVGFDYDGRILNYRITSAVDRGSRLIEAVRHDRLNYDLKPPSAVPTNVQTKRGIGSPLVKFMNLPQLAEDVEAHYPYLAAFSDPWPGDMAVFRSATTSNWALVRTFGLLASVGTLRFDLYSGPTGRWDYGNVLGVSLESGTLESKTDDAIFAGENALAIETEPGIWEIVQAAEITLDAPGLYSCRKLLRGQRGTEWAMGNPTLEGARVVVLSRAATPIPINTGDIGSPYNWRVGAASRPVASIVYTQATFTPNGRGLIPFSVEHVEQPFKRPRAPGDLEITWKRRDRAIAADSWVAVEIPMSESVEAYEVDIMNGSTVLRTLASSTTSVTYTSEDQVNDWGADLDVGDTLTIRIYQMSSTLGRGTVKEETLVF